MGRVSKEIKQEILSKVQTGERVADLSEQYAVSPKTIYGWLRQDSGEGVVSVLQYNKLKRENEEVKAKSLKFLSPQQATEHFGISSYGTDFAEYNSQQAEGN